MPKYGKRVSRDGLGQVVASVHDKLDIGSNHAEFANNELHNVSNYAKVVKKQSNEVKQQLFNLEHRELFSVGEQALWLIKHIPALPDRIVDIKQLLIELFGASRLF